MALIKVKIKIYGIVQGVFFRVSAVDKANELGIACEPKNMPDNTIEIVVEGNEENVSRFTEWCKTGPNLAKVEKIEVIHETD
jgi:acylphosphatase